MSWEQKAGVLWQVLVNTAQEGRTVFYRDLAQNIGITPQIIGHPLGPILWYCRNEKLPPLTAIAVNVVNGIPGEGFNAWPIDDIGRAQNAVYQFDWSTVGNPFEHFNDQDSVASLSTTLSRHPNSAAAIYRQIQVRGAVQSIFRKALLDAYDNQCAICRLSFPESLDAAHIIPWHIASDSEKINPNNGILLCANHHRLFDSEWIQISEDRTIVHNGENDDGYRKYDKLHTSHFHDRRLHLPNNKNLWPSAVLLRRRLELGNSV